MLARKSRVKHVIEFRNAICCFRIYRFDLFLPNLYDCLSLLISSMPSRCTSLKKYLKNTIEMKRK